MCAKFYEMRLGHTSRCYWAEIVSDLSDVPDDVYWHGMRGFTGTIRLNIVKGGVPCDFLGTNSAHVYVASERVLNLLREHGLSGYCTYDVQVSGSKIELPRYYGLTAVGRGVHILLKESGAELSSERRPDGTRRIMGVKRLVLDENQWDGSDFFYPEELPGMILVTERVKDLFKKEKVRNCKLTPIEEVSFG